MQFSDVSFSGESACICGPLSMKLRSKAGCMLRDTRSSLAIKCQQMQAVQVFVAVIVLGLTVTLKNGGSMFLKSVGIDLQDCTVSQPR